MSPRLTTQTFHSLVLQRLETEQTLSFAGGRFQVYLSRQTQYAFSCFSPICKLYHGRDPITSPNQVIMHVIDTCVDKMYCIGTFNWESGRICPNKAIKKEWVRVTLLATPALTYACRSAHPDMLRGCQDTTRFLARHIFHEQVHGQR